MTRSKKPNLRARFGAQNLKQLKSDFESFVNKHMTAHKAQVIALGALSAAVDAYNADRNSGLNKELLLSLFNHQALRRRA